ncbi:MAG: hypothetical protein M1830_010364 [Pleopsidium flavum]|nr:MAG: hypothetical protein M1830_010364 [Pleopsidium flavum]
MDDFARNLGQESDLSDEAPGISTAKDATAPLKKLLQEEASIEQLHGLKSIILDKLNGKRRLQLVALEEEYSKVHQLVEQTIVAGEGNSMLVIGARGSGKSNLVETVISDLSSQHKKDFHVVRLSGFIHTDDKLALREIWRQLGHEMEVEDDTMGRTGNYADTLSSLLALLSHPAELAANDPDHVANSVIFIMDEFDLFTSHPRQTLLYNLFDVAQSRKAPIAVIGLTTKIDVAESLEKRVKSRFSHRSVHLALPKSLAAFWEICKGALIVEEEDVIDVDGPLADCISKQNEDGLSILSSWELFVDGLWRNDWIFKHVIQSIFYRSKSVKEVFATCLIPIAELSPDMIPTGKDFAQHALLAPESKLHILEGLSDLDLSLLIAAARLDIVLDTDTCNFNMAYDEYQTMASRVKVQSSASGAAAIGAGSKIWGREVSLGAWEKLAQYELIVPAIGATSTTGGATGAGGGNGTRDVGRMGRMFRVDVGLEEIVPSVPNMSHMMSKWCKEI